MVRVWPRMVVTITAPLLSTVTDSDPRVLRMCQGRSNGPRLVSTVMPSGHSLKWMLLCTSTGRGEGSEVGGESPVDLSDERALEAADDLFLGSAFECPTLEVGACRRVPAESVDHDHVQSRVRGAVAAAVKPVPGGVAGAGWDRCNAAESGQR